MSPSPTVPGRRRLLDPIDRISEVLFGLIMALSFTCSLGAVEAGREDVRIMMVGAIGCNLAWGFIDAVIFLLTGLTERSRSFATLRDLRKTTTPEGARKVLADALPPMIAEALREDDYGRLRETLSSLAEPPCRPRLSRDDFLAAFGVFLLVVLATFPVVVPFLLLDDAVTALRVSNVIAILMLFLSGYSLGRFGRQKPWLTGFAMTAIGIVLVLITVVLGG